MAYHLRDRIAAIIVMALTAAGFIHIGNLPTGAAMFPRLVLGLAFCLSTLWLISTFISMRKARADADEAEAKTHPFMDNPLNLGILLVTTAGYIFLIDRIGYFTSTAIFMSVTALALGFRRVVFVAVTTILFVTFVYCIFILLFDRPLPVEFFQR